MPDEQLKTVLENSASSAMRITVNYLHFALNPIETEILWSRLKNKKISNDQELIQPDPIDNTWMILVWISN